MTRESRAEAMSVSPVTSDKVLKGVGVDLSTLTHIFAALNEPWLPHYAERVSPDIAEEPVGTEPVAKHAVEASASQPATRPSGMRSWRIAGVAAGACAVLAIAAIPRAQWGDTVPLPKPMSPAELGIFSSSFDRANKAYQEGRYDEAAEALAIVDGLSRRYAVPGHRVSAARLAGDIEVARGNCEQGIRHYLRAVELRGQYSSGPTTLSLYHVLGTTYAHVRDLPNAELWLKRAVLAERQAPDPLTVPYLERDLGSLALAQGHLDEASERFAGCRRLNGGRDRGLIADLESREAVLYARRGDIATAKRLLARSLAFWEKENHARWKGTTHMRTGEVEMIAGDRAAAAVHFQRAEELYRQAGDRFSERRAQESAQQANRT